MESERGLPIVSHLRYVYFLYRGTPLLLFLAVIIICGCESHGPEADAPQIPQLNPQANAIPQQNAIRIEWEPNTEENLAGYKLYRSTASGEDGFQIIATVSENEGYYEDGDVVTGIKYYYRLTAFNDSGVESDKSDAVMYTLLEKPVLTEPANQAVLKTAEPTFAWLAVPGASSYTVHVYARANDGGGEWEEIWHSESIYPYQPLRRKYNDDGNALKALENDMTYRWQVDSSSGRFAGSQSRWLYFSVSIGD